MYIRMLHSLADFNGAWAMPANVKQALCSWQNQSLKEEKVWKTIPLCIMWTVSSEERNRRCFEGKEENIALVKSTYIQSLKFWCNADFAFDVDVMLEFWNPHSYKRISTCTCLVQSWY